jgi:hypothetical protein
MRAFDEHFASQTAGAAPVSSATLCEVKTVINIEENIGKTVGRRVPPRDPLTLVGSTKEAMRAWRRAFPTPFVPKGVYRFRTHEEADAWLMKMLTRRPDRTSAS